MADHDHEVSTAQDQPPAFPVAGIGASAGGIQALQTFFSALPEKVGAALVVIVHLDPEHDSELDRIIAARTAMPVIQVTHPVALAPDHVYVIPPDRRLHMTDRQISVREFEEPRGRRAPIDQFFRSLADQHGDGFAIILTGAGSDGAVGVKAVKEGGGTILVQDPNEAEFPSMPRNAIASGFADFVLPLEDLARQFVDLVRAKRHIRLPAPDADEEDTLRRIFGHLRGRTGHDFSHYKRATVMRRIGRRMQMANVEGLPDYLAHIRDNRGELQALFADLLISVTNFFRDPQAFEALARQVIPRIFDARGMDEAVRVWVPGCATGEEAYSIAILLLEEAARREERPDFQIFASDLDMGALTTAREGCYPMAIAADVSEERLRRFFTIEGDHYRIKREVRDAVLFSSHSLLKDPPFSRIDLISCRNLMIYLDRELQQQVLATLHYALRPGGYLLLGSSETAETPAGLFRAVDREARIFQALASARDRQPVTPRLSAPLRVPSVPATLMSRRGPAAADPGLWHREALEEQAPPSMLVDESRHVLNLSESAGRFLRLPPGPPTADASELVRPELRAELLSALQHAFDHRQPSLAFPRPVQLDGAAHLVALLVRPIAQASGLQAALVMFLDGGETLQPPEEPPAAGGESDSLARLSHELEMTRSQLLLTRQDFETANEDLRAANEELQSINEEYRSTAEELETSKEELQSMNEELQTLNNELKLKLEAMSRAHSDLQNLMGATEVGTLFLDGRLAIKRFTPTVSHVFNVKAGDEGRPIADFAHRLDYVDFSRDAQAVIERLTPVEREVRNSDGRWFLLRLRPYRTLDNKIEGVIATFVDITDRKHADERLRESEERLRQAREAAALGTLDLNLETMELWWDERALELWGLPGGEPPPLAGFWAGIHPKDAAGVQAALAAAIEPAGNGRLSVEFRMARPSSGIETWIRASGVTSLAVRGEGRRRLIMTVQDMTAAKAWEQRQALVMRELTHRVKNIMSVVQAIARYSLGKSGAKPAALDDFGARLRALGAASDLLVESQFDGAELGELARVQLQPYLDNDTRRVRIAGPSLLLPPDLASQMSLVLHELATNASKYGALSKPGAGLNLTWQVTDASGERRVNMIWQEHGGPAVEKPSRRGFGMHIIERGLPGAKVEQIYEPSGLVCTIDFSLPDHPGL